MNTTEEIRTQPVDKKVLNEFHKQWYHSINWRKDLTWRGRIIMKNPLDLFIYHQIIWHSQPNIIVEIGCGFAGSACFLRDMFRCCYPINLTFCRIIGVDNRSNDYVSKDYPLPTFYDDFIEGNSIDITVVDQVARIINKNGLERVMIVLDSNHKKGHVLRELSLYHSFVSQGCYLVVEDVNVDVVLDDHDGPGPAVSQFLEEEGKNKFVIDHDCERFGLTFNCWLKRIG